MTQHKFRLVFDDHFIVRLDGLLHHVLEELKKKRAALKADLHKRSTLRFCRTIQSKSPVCYPPSTPLSEPGLSLNMIPFLQLFTFTITLKQTN